MMDYEREMYRDLAKRLVAVGFTWAYGTRSYRVEYNDKFIAGAGISKDAKSPRGKLVQQQLDEYSRYCILDARGYADRHEIDY